MPEQQTNKKIVLLVIFVILAAIFVAGIYFIFSNEKQNDTDIKADDIPNQTIVYNLTTFTTGPNNSVLDEKFETATNIEIGVDPYEIEIDTNTNSDLSNLEKVLSNFNNYPGHYKLGTITNGAFKGKTISVLVGGEMGLSFGSYLIPIAENRYIKFGGQDETFTIKQPAYPDEITFPGTEYVLKQGWGQYLWDSKITQTFKVGDIQFYVIDDSCVATKMLDGQYLTYKFNYPIIAAENSPHSQAINFKFIEGMQNTESYQYGLPACGGYCGIQTVTKISPHEIQTGKYAVIGEAPDGTKVYTFSNPENDEYKAMFDDKNSAAYIDMTDGYVNLKENKYSYQEFISFVPVVFWQDALGNWIKFTNTRFIPMAEMCKPVIYLYPETQMKLNVQVAPNGGFTKTIPEYPVTGWDVTATSKSVIKDLLTDITYPYLYWSGIGVNYPINNSIGWLVKKANVSEFLDEKLVELGLNTTEIADFKEYWVPKLSERKFYQLYFLTKEQIDGMSPLIISPIQPDNVIRVMLTAKGMDKEVKLKGQILPETPSRDGFTVVEWGGALVK